MYVGKKTEERKKEGKKTTKKAGLVAMRAPLPHTPAEARFLNGFVFGPRLCSIYHPSIIPAIRVHTSGPCIRIPCSFLADPVPNSTSAVHDCTRLARTTLLRDNTTFLFFNAPPPLSP